MNRTSPLNKQDRKAANDKLPEVKAARLFDFVHAGMMSQISCMCDTCSNEMADSKLIVNGQCPTCIAAGVPVYDS